MIYCIVWLHKETLLFHYICQTRQKLNDYPWASDSKQTLFLLFRSSRNNLLIWSFLNRSLDYKLRRNSFLRRISWNFYPRTFSAFLSNFTNTCTHTCTMCRTIFHNTRIVSRTNFYERWDTFASLPASTNDIVPSVVIVSRSKEKICKNVAALKALIRKKQARFSPRCPRCACDSRCTGWRPAGILVYLRKRGPCRQACRKVKLSCT